MRFVIQTLDYIHRHNIIDDKDAKRIKRRGMRAMREAEEEKGTEGDTHICNDIQKEKGRR